MPTRTKRSLYGMRTRSNRCRACLGGSEGINWGAQWYMRTYSHACDRLDLEAYHRVLSGGKPAAATSFPLSDSARKNISQHVSDLI